jgi:hypothetical protein
MKYFWEGRLESLFESANLAILPPHMKQESRARREDIILYNIH